MLTAIIIFLVFSSVVSILWVGAQDVLAGRITPGTLSQFILYAVFAAGGLGRIERGLGRDFAGVGRGRTADRTARRSKPDIKAPAQPVALPQPARGEVAFEGVRFAYPSRPDAFVLDGVSFHVRPGEKVAIVGPSGAGKSTIFHLLLRFYDVSAGTVAFDGVRVAEADPRALRSRIALVPQDVVDVRRLASPRTSASAGPMPREAEIVRAAELAAAAEFIERLPRGLRDADRRARRHAVGRPAPAHRDRARDPARRAAAAARRGDLLARRRKRDAGFRPRLSA